MRTGLVLPFSGDAPEMIEYAARAHELGFDGVFATDHLFVPGRPEASTLEPFTLLSAIAASHPGLHVGTLVARVSLRHPAILAKVSASLDDLSGGRAIIGLGSGDALDVSENRAFGLAAPEAAGARHRLLAETADFLRALFRGGQWPGGAMIPPAPGRLAPLPARAGGPPVWLGGMSQDVVRLAAEHADGWNGWGPSLEDFAERAGLLKASGVEPTWAGIVTLGDDADDTARRVAERRSRGLPDAWAGDLGDMRGFVHGLAEAGATWAMFRLPLERAEVLAESLPEVRS